MVLGFNPPLGGRVCAHVRGGGRAQSSPWRAKPVTGVRSQNISQPAQGGRALVANAVPKCAKMNFEENLEDAFTTMRFDIIYGKHDDNYKNG